MVDCSALKNILGAKFIFWRVEMTVMKESILPIRFPQKAKTPGKFECISSLYGKQLFNESIPELKKSKM